MSVQEVRRKRTGHLPQDVAGMWHFTFKRVRGELRIAEFWLLRMVTPDELDRKVRCRSAGAHVGFLCTAMSQCTWMLLYTHLGFHSHSSNAATHGLCRKRIAATQSHSSVTNT